jgi:hypothetical protein
MLREVKVIQCPTESEACYTGEGNVRACDACECAMSVRTLEAELEEQRQANTLPCYDIVAGRQFNNRTISVNGVMT